MRASWWAKFERDSETGCLLWTGHIDAAGYGRSKGSGAAVGEVYVHRIVYLLTVGPIPEGKELDHVKERGCAYRHCAEVGHLEPVTHAENKQRAIRTHCTRNHLLEGPNLRVEPRTGKRYCKTCAAERARALRARRAVR